MSCGNSRALGGRRVREERREGERGGEGRKGRKGGACLTFTTILAQGKNGVCGEVYRRFESRGIITRTGR